MPRTIDSRSNVQGWERYPENLTYSGCDAYGYNLSSYKAQITSDAKRLFTPEDEIAIKVIEFDNGGNELCPDR